MSKRREASKENINGVLKQVRISGFDTPDIARAQLGILADIATSLSVIADAADVFTKDLVRQQTLERIVAEKG